MPGLEGSLQGHDLPTRPPPTNVLLQNSPNAPKQVRCLGPSDATPLGGEGSDDRKRPRVELETARDTAPHTVRFTRDVPERGKWKARPTGSWSAAAGAGAGGRAVTAEGHQGTPWGHHDASSLGCGCHPGGLCPSDKTHQRAQAQRTAVPEVPRRHHATISGSPPRHDARTHFVRVKCALRWFERIPSAGQPSPPSRSRRCSSPIAKPRTCRRCFGPPAPGDRQPFCPSSDIQSHEASDVPRRLCCSKSSSSAEATCCFFRSA